jgi:hypothetical protein
MPTKAVLFCLIFQKLSSHPNLLNYEHGSKHVVVILLHVVKTLISKSDVCCFQTKQKNNKMETNVYHVTHYLVTAVCVNLIPDAWTRILTKLDRLMQAALAVLRSSMVPLVGKIF